MRHDVAQPLAPPPATHCSRRSGSPRAGQPSGEPTRPRKWPDPHAGSNTVTASSAARDRRFASHGPAPVRALCRAAGRSGSPARSSSRWSRVPARPCGQLEPMVSHRDLRVELQQRLGDAAQLLRPEVAVVDRPHDPAIHRPRQPPTASRRTRFSSRVRSSPWLTHRPVPQPTRAPTKPSARRRNPRRSPAGPPPGSWTRG